MFFFFRCNMPNGKTLWLCPKHEKFSFTQTEEKYKDQIYKGVPGQEQLTESEKTDTGKGFWLDGRHS